MEALYEHYFTGKKWIFSSAHFFYHKQAKYTGHHTGFKYDWFQHDRNNIVGGVTIDSQDQYLIITGHSGIYSSNKAVEDIVTTKSDEVSIIRFCEM